MAWDFVTEMHEPIRQFCFPTEGKKLPAVKWDELIEMVPGIGSRAKFIHASDHCSNMNNTGGCKYAPSLGEHW
jgi:hypothetical protein